MRTATPLAASRRETDLIASILDRARQAALTVAVDEQQDTVTVDCPRCTNSLTLARHHWHPVGAARIVDLFITTHGRRKLP